MSSLKDFVIQGRIYQSGSLITSGLVRVRNINKPDVIVVVPIGQMNDGTPNTGFYDAWWVSGGATSAPDVATLGDVFEVSVYPLNAVNDLSLPVELMMNPVTTSVPPIVAAQNAPALTQAHISAGLQVYDVYATVNSLPRQIVIIPEDITLGFNLRFTNNPVVKWAWEIPADDENQPIHFKVEWSKDPSFPTHIAGKVGTATTLPDDPTRALFRYEYNPGTFGLFPSGGVLNRTGWRCFLEMNLGTTADKDGEYYWRVCATDGTQV